VRYVLALDQGTTSSRAILFDEEGAAVCSAQREFRQIYPQPGWVEHDPREIFETQRAVAREALRDQRLEREADLPKLEYRRHAQHADDRAAIGDLNSVQIDLNHNRVFVSSCVHGYDRRWLY